jgi:hypothetical protein
MGRILQLLICLRLPAARDKSSAVLFNCRLLVHFLAWCNKHGKYLPSCSQLHDFTDVDWKTSCWQVSSLVLVDCQSVSAYNLCGSQFGNSSSAFVSHGKAEILLTQHRSYDVPTIYHNFLVCLSCGCWRDCSKDNIEVGKLGYIMWTLNYRVCFCCEVFWWNNSIREQQHILTHFLFSQTKRASFRSFRHFLFTLLLAQLFFVILLAVRVGSIR